MNKKQFINTYKKIDSLDKTKTTDKAIDKQHKSAIYQSEHDERLIKDFHYAKFQKNQQAIRQSKKLKSLLDKEEWDEEDTQKLLESLR